ncbi:peptidyl-tRNA hydrolase 2, mitochondrial [Anabrus simplex]|uniref:peptidyl-tRNA hydrolase 2, mitochondrial n=1 Tax=Anabrus simplex TaxID=316456 RepID=UPI0034DD700F
MEDGGLMSWLLDKQGFNPMFFTGIGIGCGFCVAWAVMKSTGTGMGFKDVDDPVPESVANHAEGEHKMILVVRNDLKMGKGKVAAQCSHAAVGAYRQAKEKCPKILRAWEECGQPKIVVKTETEQELVQLAREARSMGLVISLITDAGRTQIAPNSKTVLGIGPGPADLVDKVTGHLKLY